jgi:hypothetical protein
MRMIPQELACSCPTGKAAMVASALVFQVGADHVLEIHAVELVA